MSANEKKLELKYCERCGGLWLRERGCGEIYCVECLVAIEELPPPKKRPRSVERLRVVRLPKGPHCVMPWDADGTQTEWELWPSAGER